MTFIPKVVGSCENDIIWVEWLILIKMSGNCENMTFHQQTTLWAPPASKIIYSIVFYNTSSDVRPPGAVFYFLRFHEKADFM